MLDLFAIFSKGGIVLWYFQGTNNRLTNSVNVLIKSVILQVSIYYRPKYPSYFFKNPAEATPVVKNIK